MTELGINPGNVSTSASALMGRTVLGPDGKVLGRVKELAVDVSTDQTHVAALVLQEGFGSKGKKMLMPVVEMVWPVTNEAALRAKGMPASYKEQHDYLLLDYDLLDQQIIDVALYRTLAVQSQVQFPG